MKFVIDQSIAASWYLPNRVTTKALGLRIDLLQGVHELLVPDIFFVDCTEMLVQGEKADAIPAGRTQSELNDLYTLAIPVHSSAPLAAGSRGRTCVGDAVESCGEFVSRLG